MDIRILFPNGSNHINPLLGGKALGLYQLHKHNYNIPQTLIIPATPLSFFGYINKSLDDFYAIQESILNHPFSEDEIEALNYLSSYESQLLAVRSSGIGEDGVYASYAGQFDTYLNVKKETIYSAIRNCQASGFSTKIRDYNNILHKASVAFAPAVVIQPMIEALLSGVILTVHPTLGRHFLLIEIVDGLGEKLVQGDTTPRQYSIHKNAAKNCPQVNQINPKDETWLGALANLSCSIEADFSQASEIEFSITTTAIFVLQRRPITARVPDTNTDLIKLIGNYRYSYASYNARPYHTVVAFGVFGKALASLTGFSYKKTLSITNCEFNTKGFHDIQELAEASNYFNKIWVDIDHSRPLLKKIIFSLRRANKFTSNFTCIQKKLNLKQCVRLVGKAHVLYKNCFAKMILSQPQHVDHLSIQLNLLCQKLNFDENKLSAALRWKGLYPWDEEERHIEEVQKKWSNLTYKQKKWN